MELFNNKIKIYKIVKHKLIKLSENKNKKKILKINIKNHGIINCSNNNLILNKLMLLQKNHEINLINFYS